MSFSIIRIVNHENFTKIQIFPDPISSQKQVYENGKITSDLDALKVALRKRVIAPVRFFPIGVSFSGKSSENSSNAIIDGGTHALAALTYNR